MPTSQTDCFTCSKLAKVVKMNRINMQYATAPSNNRHLTAGKKQRNHGLSGENEDLHLIRLIFIETNFNSLDLLISSVWSLCSDNGLLLIRLIFLETNFSSLDLLRSSEWSLCRLIFIETWDVLWKTTCLTYSQNYKFHVIPVVNGHVIK